MSSLYPFKFKTIYKDKIWGGQKMKSVLNKDFSPLPNCGETWEISGVPGNVSEVINGELKGKNLQELLDEYKDELVGKKVFQIHKNEFPLLIKFIDANQDLSIQVHPDDALARERHNSFGKTEMWYIMQADEGAKLITGFNQPVNQNVYLEHLENKTLDSILNKEDVYKDDVFFIPAGRVHTIGKGCFLAEIQQSSDVTYRIYDFDRTDAQGNKRELHTEQALDAIDYRHDYQYKTTYKPQINDPVNVVTCPFFETNVLELEKPMKRNHENLDSFKILIGTEGKFTLEWEGNSMDCSLGEALLIPASVKSYSIVPKGKCKTLETYIPLNS